MAEQTIKLDVVFYREDNQFVAHCLQLDIVTSANTMEQARCDIEDLIKAHVEYTIENDNWDYFYHRAPDKYWALKDNATPYDDETTQNEFHDIDKNFIWNIIKWQSDVVDHL